MKYTTINGKVKCMFIRWGEYMYEYIKGTFKGINKEYIILENNDIGYKIYSSGNTMSSLPNVGEKITLHILQIVRQDFMGLYGFGTVDELELFKKLLTVNGVGAKASLSLLSVTSVENLKRAIILGDYKLLVKAPGIGNKISQRIILELKDKMNILIDNDETLDSGAKAFEAKLNEDAKDALKSLGYSDKEVERALKNVVAKGTEKDNDSVENIIKNCLRFLMN